MLIVVVSQAYVTPPLGSFLLLCSAVPLLMLAISAIHWAVREKNGARIAIPFALAIVLVYGTLLCAYTPDEPRTLTQDDLEYIQLGIRFEDIAQELGGGNWLSEAEFFTVVYDIEGEMQLVLVFEDGVHLSGATLHYPNGNTTTMGAAPALGTAGQ
jgi:hypothetical protein